MLYQFYKIQGKVIKTFKLLQRVVLKIQRSDRGQRRENFNFQHNFQRFRVDVHT